MSDAGLDMPAESETAASGGLNVASIGQVYETTIYADNVPSMRFVTVPQRAVEPARTDTVEDCLQILGLEGFESTLFFPFELPFMLWQCLTAQRPYPEGVRTGWSGEDRRLIEFAEYLAFEDLIPFELSEQQSRSLSKLMTIGSLGGAALGGAKLGAAGGFIVGAAGGPLVIVTTTAGFVVGGLVGAVTAGVGEKIYGAIGGGSSKPGTKKPRGRFFRI
jgi:hypothetical protein